MWEVLVKLPLGNVSKRKFIMLIATFLVVVLGYLFITPTDVYALDASWNTDNSVVKYNNHDYVGPETATQNSITNLQAKATYYTYKESPSKAFIIYFSPGVDPPGETEATLADATLVNGKVTAISNSQPITITPNTSPSGNTVSEGTTSCAVEGIGWIICPITSFLAKGMDLVYSYITGFLEVRPLATSQDQALYRAWAAMRDIANVVFVIGFLILVYSQITGSVMNNYTIKKMLPRIVVAAVLVNISFWVCALAVDVFNVLGYAVQDLFISIRNSLVGKEGNSWDVVSWESMTSFVLSGGTIAAGVGVATFLGVTTAATTIAGGAGAVGLIMLVLPLLISLLFVVLVTFLILAARQAIITILIIIAPLAFVAYLLPNTEKWFEKWRDALMTLLIVFPAFSVVFGGSQLAAAAIIQNADSLNVIILAMAVQVAPLAITPLLLRLGGGVLNRFANVINNAEKGVFDRSKNWAKGRNEANTAAGQDALAKRAQRLGVLGQRPNSSTRSTRRGRFAENAANRLNPYNMSYAREYDRRRREGLKAGHEANAAGLFTQTKAGREVYNLNQDADGAKHVGENANYRAYKTAMSTGTDVDNIRRRTEHHQSHVDKGVGDLYEEGMTNHAERDLQTQISTTANLRNTKITANVEKGVADLYKNKVDALGEQSFREEVEASRALTRVVKDTHHAKKQAEQFETIVQKAAEKSWNDRIRNDSATQELHLRAVRYEGSAKKAEQQLVEMTDNINAVGRSTPGLASQNARIIADQIQSTTRDISIADQAVSSAKIKQQSEFAKALKASESLRVRAAGVDDQGGVNRVLASAKKAVSDELIKATNNFQDTLDYDIASNPEALDAGFRNAEDPTEKIVYARLMARNAPGLKRLKNVLRDYTASRDPENEEVMLLKEILSGDDAFRNAGRDMEVWANNERNSNGVLYRNFEDVQDTIGVINNISADRFARMNAYKQHDALYRLQQNDPEALRGLVARINASPMARNALKQHVINLVDGVPNGQQIQNPDRVPIEDIDD